MTSIPLPLTGGCQCGAIRYRITIEPTMLYACHCQECQKQSASAFGLSMSTPAAGVAITLGEPREWRRVAPSGREVIAVFCGSCGTRIMHRSGANPAAVTIKPGSLDDTGWLRPGAHIWTGSGQPWTSACREEALVIEGQPEAEDFPRIRAQWRAINDLD